MKKAISILLCLVLLLSLCACRKTDEIRFYYARRNIVYGRADGVIASEVRDAAGHEEDLAYLLMLYLEGPHSDTLTAPFPKGTFLTKLEVQENGITLLLSGAFGHLQGLDQTIACTCIAYTCFAISDCASVTIKSTMSGAPAMTLTRDSVTLTDVTAAQ